MGNDALIQALGQIILQSGSTNTLLSTDELLIYRKNGGAGLQLISVPSVAGASFIVNYYFRSGVESIVEAGTTILFSSALGTATDGSDWQFGGIYCYDPITGMQVGFKITERKETGFKITPDINAVVEYTTKLKA